jgi:hypothetical protein
VFQLTGDPDFPDNPDESGFLTSFSAPVNFADNYGSRIIGYVHPPVNGTYYFSISGDDFCELWLSSDSLSAGLQKIAQVPGWTQYGEWDKYPDQRSSGKWLEAGKKYLIQALHKEGGNDDHLEAAWEYTGNPLQVIPGEYLSPFDVSSSVQDIQTIKTRMSLAPNPAKSELTIIFQDPVEGALDILTLTGCIMVRKNLQGPPAAIKVDVSGLTPGMYLVRIRSNEGETRQKLVITR